ncbi:hypothetical protein L484_013858 [Morus notabilis]|uniref:Uncharacterized protein n=1 Tax=Morus notabilis TaxID=981085 RepID=W9QN74_9ROSA|nr:hypothetical protein L484_013858 [Morus notabilis]
MGLQLYWYDIVSFGIVVVSLCSALWVILKKEGGSSSRLEDGSSTTMYESLLVARPVSESFVSALQSGHLRGSQLWRSCWKEVHPKWLLLTRLLSFLVLAGFLAWDVVEWDATIFLYYTEWTFALVIVYFGLGIIVSAYGCWLSSNQPHPENEETIDFLRSGIEETRTETSNAHKAKEIKVGIKLQSQEIRKKAGFWGYLMQISFQTCAGAVILTDIVFWCVIVPFLSNARLGLNLPFPWFRLSYFVLWSCLYVIFQWVIHACGFSWWPYPFLELDTPWAPLW